MAQLASFSEKKKKKKEQGFSLIEILIALMLLSLVLIVLAGTAVIITKTSMKNRLRDAAVLVTQDQINEWRNRPWNEIQGYAATAPADDLDPQVRTVTKRLGEVPFTFTTSSKFVVSTANANFITCQVLTTWNFMGQNYSHMATQILKQ